MRKKRRFRRHNWGYLLGWGWVMFWIGMAILLMTLAATGHLHSGGDDSPVTRDPFPWHPPEPAPPPPPPYNPMVPGWH